MDQTSVIVQKMMKNTKNIVLPQTMNQSQEISYLLFLIVIFNTIHVSILQTLQNKYLNNNKHQQTPKLKDQTQVSSLSCVIS